jgi:hypothetical protein
MLTQRRWAAGQNGAPPLSTLAEAGVDPAGGDTEGRPRASGAPSGGGGRASTGPIFQVSGGTPRASRARPRLQGGPHTVEDAR